VARKDRWPFCQSSALSQVCIHCVLVNTLTALDLIHPTSTWTYWATLRRHSCLLRAATFASSQVTHIPRRSFLTIPLQFVLGRLGPLLKPRTSQYSAWCVMRRWSIRIVWPSQRSLLPLRVFRILCCPVLALTSSFVTLSFQETPNMLLSHLWWAASSHSIAFWQHWPTIMLPLNTYLQKWLPIKQNMEENGCRYF